MTTVLAPAPTSVRKPKRREQSGILMPLGQVEPGQVIRTLGGSWGVAMWDDHCPRWAVPVDFWDEPAGLVDRSELVRAFPSP